MPPGGQIFLSHVSEERDVALGVRDELQVALPGTTVFVSAVDIRLGADWEASIRTCLRNARVVLVLCSRRSLAAPWVNFESGAGWGLGKPVLPLCQGGLRRGDLPRPFSDFQSIDLERPDDCEALVRDLGETLQVDVAPGFDPSGMAEGLRQRPERRPGIGIDLVHGQDQWERRRGSVFSLDSEPPPDLQGKWSITALDRPEDLLPPVLARLSGLILGLPYRSEIDADFESSIVDWVHDGGRLLMLGFELGDRHHGGNLGALARHFGIAGSTDIVGPPGTVAKPYDVPVRFDPAAADAFELTRGLGEVTLPNVQTLRVEPGGVVWLTVGANVVLRPRGDSVQYQRGVLLVDRFEEAPHQEAQPVAVAAPPDLCGDGAVLAIGTWQLVGRREPLGANTTELLRRLLEWLTDGHRA